jgi:hypothetical protein
MFQRAFDEGESLLADWATAPFVTAAALTVSSLLPHAGHRRRFLQGQDD